MKSIRPVSLALLLVSAMPVLAQPQPSRGRRGSAVPASTPVSQPQQLPIREITVFKDGHDLVVRRGNTHFDARGSAVLDVPAQPVLGTFWAFSTTPNARIASLRAG